MGQSYRLQCLSSQTGVAGSRCVRVYIGLRSAGVAPDVVMPGRRSKDPGSRRRQIRSRQRAIAAQFVGLRKAASTQLAINFALFMDYIGTFEARAEDLETHS